MSVQHNEVKKILCEECKTTRTMHIDVPKYLGGPRRQLVVMHTDRCRSDQIQWCCQYITSDSWSYSSRCGKPVKGTLRDGTPVCGLHKSVQDRQIKEAEERESRREIASYLQDVMAEKIKLIQELTGIIAKIHVNYGYGVGYRTWIDPEWILVKADDLIAAIQIEEE
jgi:hypothetical protein